MLSINGKKAVFSNTILLALNEEIFFQVPELDGHGLILKAFENPPVGGSGPTLDKRGDVTEIAFNVLRLAAIEHQIDYLPGIDKHYSATIVTHPVGDFQIVRITVFDNANLNSN